MTPYANSRVICGRCFDFFQLDLDFQDAGDFKPRINWFYHGYYYDNAFLDRNFFSRYPSKNIRLSYCVSDLPVQANTNS